MRISYRAHGGSQDYWQRRWVGIGVDSGAVNLHRYPGRYADCALSATRPDGPVLEAGCGAGRLLRHYHKQGVEIVGIDFITSVLTAIRREDSTIPLAAGNITKLPFPDEFFSAILAFGLYHGLESGLEQAVADSRRVLKPGGVLCASMRLNNLQNCMTDWMADRDAPRGERRFHKLNLTTTEFKALISGAGFKVYAVDYVENMSFLYKFSWLRHASQRVFREEEARSEGYRLNLAGNLLQRASMALIPVQMANLAVITARAV